MKPSARRVLSSALAIQPLAHAESAGYVCGCRQPLASLGSAGLFCSTICSTPLCAQEPKPSLPIPHYSRKAFIVEVSLLGAAKTADAISTRQALDRGGWENNPIFGRHPSLAKQAGINLGIFAAKSTAFYFTERSRHKWIGWTGRAFIGHAILEHLRLAACNAGIDPRSPVIRNCRPYGRGL